MKKEHCNTEPTPTSLRRETQLNQRRARNYRSWRDDARVNDWCEWEIRCFPMRVKSMIRVYNSNGNYQGQVWS